MYAIKIGVYLRAYEIVLDIQKFLLDKTMNKID
jgi:hypothetical protein